MALEKSLVSIITITFNSERFIQETVQSVCKQSYENFEYIIQDGGSTDRTLEIIRSFEDPRIKIFTESDNGIADAMNKAIQKAKGRFVGIIHSDDSYSPDAIELSLNAMQSTGARWSYGKLDYIDYSGKHLYEAGTTFSLAKLKRFMLMNHPTVFCERAMYDEFGNFNAKYRLAMDYDLVLRFALRETPAYVDRPIARMRLGGESSKNFRSEIQAAREVMEIKQSLLHSSFDWRLYFFWTVCKILVRKSLTKIPFGTRLIEELRERVNPNYASETR
jgi:glycosyltransferase involved in cell wall biosynthesis